MKDESGLDFNVVLVKIRELVKGIRKSMLRWELFQKYCLVYDINSSIISIDLKIRWHSMMRMLETAIYLDHLINHFLMDLDDNEDLSSQYSRTDTEWELAEVFYVFLISFKHVIIRFQNNQEKSGINYLFFVYDRMFNHIDNVFSSLRSSECFVNALMKMERKLSEYYNKMNLYFVYDDAMILNFHCKFSIFNEETWFDVDSDQYSRACRRRFE